ncbi:MAG: DUF6115 domain-containing protein [Lachnospiraceae bacterium]|nr:DUF6115 domain-containing protein [Lachnospiraceae bacterium]
MTALEGCLIVIGIIAIVVSYFISEKSAEERMKKAVDELVLGEGTKQTLIRQAKDTVEEALNGMSEEIAGKAEIQLEKLSNEKIMMVHEYADTVLEEIGKNHQEVMFLYSMLDDKDREVKNTVKEAQKMVKSMRELSQRQEYAIKQAEAAMEYLEAENSKIQEERKSLAQKFESELDLEENGNGEKKEESSEQSKRLERNLEKNSDRKRRKRSRKKNQEKKWETMEFVPNEEEYFQENQSEALLTEIEEKEDKRNQIIRLYQQGKSKLEIAKELKLSMGEVSLVIDLYYTPEKRRGNME